MAGEFAIKRKVITSRGFSLLEIIFVLAFIGIVLVAAATYARKFIDEKTRQTAADAVAQEVYGVLQFVNAENIEIFQSNNPTDTTTRVTKKVTNPLYQMPNVRVYPEAQQGSADANKVGLAQNPIFNAHSGGIQSLTNPASSLLSPYVGRNFSKSITSSINNTIPILDGGVTYYSHSLKWSQAEWNQAGRNGSVRSYFTDSGCGVVPANPVYFSQQFLSCSENPVFNNSEVRIPRIDLVNKKGSFELPHDAQPGNTSTAVERVDVYVSFNPADGNPARFEQFVSPLMTAFKTQKIQPNADNIFLVRNMPGQDNGWVFLDKRNGIPATNTTPTDDLARYTDLPEMVGYLRSPANANFTYALRFTFDGKGDYLRADGLNSATKLCWNTEAGAAGPCLTAPSEDLLALKKRNNPREFADLQVGSLISTSSHGDIIDEYYTAPRVQYRTFTNAGKNSNPYYQVTTEEDGVQVTRTCQLTGNDLATADCTVPAPTGNNALSVAYGAISVPYQHCPSGIDAVGNPITMHHRISASVSSIISGINLDGNSNMRPIGIGEYPNGSVFSSQNGGLNVLADTSNNGNHISINRLGGVTIIMDRNPATDMWMVGAMVATEDTSSSREVRLALQYYNPPWLSLLVTTWCSSIPQP